MKSLVQTITEKKSSGMYSVWCIKTSDGAKEICAYKKYEEGAAPDMSDYEEMAKDMNAELIDSLANVDEDAVKDFVNKNKKGVDNFKIFFTSEQVHEFLSTLYS